MMPRHKPDDSLETPIRARSLGVALGATELMFIAGILLLATGCVLVFGFGTALLVVGGALTVTAWLMQFAG